MFLYNQSGLSGPFAPEDEYISELKNKQQEKEREALEKEQKRQERKRIADKNKNKKRTSSTRNITKKLKRNPRFLNLTAKAMLRMNLIFCVLSATWRILMKRMSPWTACRPCHNWYHDECTSWRGDMKRMPLSSILHV